jgi:hypothetical protein
MKQLLTIIILICLISCCPHPRTPQEEVDFQKKVQAIKDSTNEQRHGELDSIDKSEPRPKLDTSEIEKIKETAYMTGRDSVQLLYSVLR